MKYLFLFLFILICPFVAHAVDFGRTLSFGMRGEDVRSLQMILNSDTDTRVAVDGAGSPGSETDYFGHATRRALMKLQEKYRAEILVPAGLAHATGVFGSMTRGKLKTIVENIKEKTPVIATSTAITEKGEVILMYPSQYSGKTGTMITLYGAGFLATGNTVYFGGNHVVSDARSRDGQNIALSVPNISKGIYHLSVKNTLGESKKGPWFVVTDGVTPEPRIESITPATVLRGQAVVIKGSGFTSRGNIIQYGVGIEQNVHSEDGVTLSYIIPMSVFSELKSSRILKTSLPLNAVVINENGVSNAMSFKLNI